MPLAGSHGVKDASCDSSVIERWWTEHPNANIAIACGADCRAPYVVDIDAAGPSHKHDGFESLRMAHIEMPSTATVTTPGGGQHLYFSYNPSTGLPALRNQTNANGFAGVDIRASGGYIIAPPSRVGNGKYSWTSTQPMAEFPSALIPVQPAADQAPAPSVQTSACQDILRRATAYLAKMPESISGEGGHNALLRAATALVIGFRLSEQDALALLNRDFNQRCNPPWSDKELLHKISEAQKNALGSQLGYLLEPQSDRGEFASPLVADIPQWSESLYHPPGLVGVIADHFRDTAGCDQPKFAIAAALGLVSVIVGRNVEDEERERGNVFILGVGPSSSGKDDPFSAIKSMLGIIGMRNVVVSKPSSGSALEDALAFNPTRIVMIDEAGHYLSNCKQKSDSNSYLKTVIPTMTDLWSKSSGGKSYDCRTLADERGKARKEPKHLNAPYLCAYVTCTPGQFFPNVSESEIEDGSFTRYIPFITRTVTRHRRVIEDPELKQSIADRLRGAIEASKFQLTISPQDNPLISAETPVLDTKPICAKSTKEAIDVFERFEDLKTHFLSTAADNGDTTLFCWSKAVQNAKRVAILIAWGKNPSSPTIDEECASYAVALIKRTVTDTIIELKSCCNSALEEKEFKAKRILQEHGEIEKSDFCRKTQFFNETQLGERSKFILRMTDELGLVTIEHRNNGSSRKSTTWYKWTGPIIQ